jgi:hypothetical protein
MRIQVQPAQQNQTPRSTWYTQGGQGTVTNTQPEFGAQTTYPAVAPSLHWPDAVAYREAIQNPQASLAPPELRHGAVSQDRRGLPIAYTGRFAVVFRVVDAIGTQWAVRCFTAAPQDEVIARTDRYRLIASHASELGDIFVPFKYFEQGIRVGSAWYPLVAMRWASGETLGKFTDRNLHDPEALRTLAGTLSALLKRLEDAGIAHGDWQHDNLMVSESGKHVTLVDYDGMFVPEFAGLVADELGHPNYQHPGRTPLEFGPNMDRFACLTMQAALLGLSHEPSLWSRFSDGESLLFKKIDFQDPSVSPVFRALREVAEKHDDATLADCLARLGEACLHAPDAVMEPAVAPLESAYTAETISDWDSLPTTATVLTKATPRGTEETVLPAQTGVKWWQAGPAIALPDPVAVAQASSVATAKWFAGQATPLVMGGAGQAQQYKPVETWAFIERVFRDETLSAERKHFMMSRAGMAVLAAFTVLFLMSLFGRGGSFPFYLFFWVFNIGSLGYANWPRKKIYDELEAEIAKMEKLMNERREKIAARQHAFSPGGGLTPLGAAAFGSLHDYVNDRLSKTQVNQALNVKGITLTTLKVLKGEGITTALHLQGRTTVSEVPAHEFAALQQWCRDLEMRFADEYRHSGAVNRPQNTSAEIARWEQEAAEFERERDRLLREKSQFPDVSFWNVYWRKLFGLPENVSASQSNATP